MSFGRVYMRIFDAHIYALLVNTIYMGKNTLIFAYKTRIYMRTSELRVSLEGITNSTQRILIRKQEEKQGGMVSYCKILH